MYGLPDINLAMENLVLHISGIEGLRKSLIAKVTVSSPGIERLRISVRLSSLSNKSTDGISSESKGTDEGRFQLYRRNLKQSVQLHGNDNTGIDFIALLFIKLTADPVSTKKVKLRLFNGVLRETCGVEQLVEIRAGSMDLENLDFSGAVDAEDLEQADSLGTADTENLEWAGALGTADLVGLE
ncbi:hypothetical protein HW555_002253 [Spodoptera exigua]|uniref:Uncharacterized protein n=1 Tax=Spodoptera exigua TaxID=7107 RepID=A0A835GQQ0_SPOEX|nr:hypothetical protein HW555_002253 [Spodoptera exigua]